jgi:hypothetical protein
MRETYFTYISFRITCVVRARYYYMFAKHIGYYLKY